MDGTSYRAVFARNDLHKIWVTQNTHIDRSLTELWHIVLKTNISYILGFKPVFHFNVGGVLYLYKKLAEGSY